MSECSPPYGDQTLPDNSPDPSTTYPEPRWIPGKVMLVPPLPPELQFIRRMVCPAPFPDCRPGACNCDVIQDARGMEARNIYIASLADLVVEDCAHCDGNGYTVTKKADD